jgi:cytochrome c
LRAPGEGSARECGDEELAIMVLVQSVGKARLLGVGVALALAVGLTALPGASQAQLLKNADPVRGQELARRLCANCHATEPNGGQAVNPDVPSFAAIARQPNVTAERLAGRIIVPHPAMPNTQLTVAEIRDVIAYIVALQTR